MAVQRGAHPSADILKAFGLGKLDDSSSGVVLDHLDQCEDCRKQVTSLSGDDFLNRLRQARGRSFTPAPAKALPDVSRAAKPPANRTPVPNLPPELANNPQYETLRELGRGGMGVVYLAKNKLMDRLEVLKVVNKALLDHPGAVERFLREIRSAAKLSHANVVAAYHALQEGELLAFAMEYVEGQDLASLVKSQGPLPIPHACFYVQQAAHGLQHAYEKGMVHRDIKPQNLILAREGKKHIVKVLDFGLAKATREKKDDTGLTGEGKMLGTPDYIAPEQTLDAAKADIRADIYSLGCTLYYLLSGRPPFSASSLGAMLLAHQMHEAKPLNLVRPEVPEELAAVVRKMMVKSPAKRYQTPLDLVQALSPFVKQGATPKSSPELSSGTAEPKPVVKIATPVVPPPAPPVEAPKPAAVWESLTENSAESIIPSKSGPIRRPRAATVRERRSQKKWLMGGGLSVGVLLLALVGMWAGGIFERKVEVKTKDGILVIEVNEPNPVVLVDGERVTVSWHNGGKKAEIRVKPGTHKVEIQKDGFSVDGQELTFKDGGKEVFTARLLPKTLPQPQNVEEWIREVRAPPAEQQIERVKDKLKQLNPGFDGELKPTTENGVVTGLWFMTDHVTDLNPLRALPQLKSLILAGTHARKGILTDLSPLKGMSLTTLACEVNQVADLSPLKGMPLEHLNCLMNPVNDLSPLRGMPLKDLALWSWTGKDLRPLKGMPLTYLNCGGNGAIEDLSPLAGMPLTSLCLNYTNVSDLTPLKGMPLWGLFAQNTRVSDLTPLKGMPLSRLTVRGSRVTDLTPIRELPLTDLTCDFQPERDMELLRSIKTLEKINGKPAAELLKPAAELPKQADGFVPLFNGKDLSGWKYHPKRQGDWHVEGGILKSRGKPSHLFSERGDYENFRLQVEARINKGGNSGVFFRSEFGLSIWNGGLPSGYEAEITEAETGTLIDWPGGVAGVNVRRYPISPNQWFPLEVIAEGNHIVILVNCHKAVDQTLPAGYRKRGHIALQHFTPQTVVEFRKIEIKELPGGPSSLPASGGLPPEAKQAAKAYEDACAKARAKLLADFDTAVERLTQVKGPAEQRLKLIEVVKEEKKRFENKGLIPWSEPMRPYLAKYFTSTGAAEDRLRHAYNSLIIAQHKAKKESMGADLKADLENLIGVRLLARWRHLVDDKPAGSISLYSNGRINNVNGSAAWNYAKGVLIYRWPNSNMPGGVLIDTLNVSADGTRYAGTNNNPPGKRPKVTGVYLKDE